VNKPLSIGVVCYPSIGGSGVIASELAVGLAKRGHRVHVIASAPPSRALPECDRLLFHEVAVSDYPLFEHPPYGMAVASTIIEVAREYPLDLVHLHYAVPHAASGFLARQVLGKDAPKFVTTLHGTDVTRFSKDSSYREMTRFCVSQSDAVTVPSTFLQNEARKLLDLEDRFPIEVIPNFVDTAHFTPAETRDRGRLSELFQNAPDADGPVLFHVSNFRAVKRVGDLIEVLSLLRKTIPARLVLVGDGPERAAAAQKARDLGVSKSVCFLGKRSDFVEHLRHADAFVLPSESESFGVAALEALSAGVPVFGYRVGGLPEVVSADVGRLVAPFDVKALAEAIAEVLLQPEKRAQLGGAGRERAVKSFQREPAFDRYDTFFRRVLSEGR
jgi:N-acetyl-alpha-D-glucosaminyl L-malate synthase BshA